MQSPNLTFPEIRIHQFILLQFYMKQKICIFISETSSHGGLRLKECHNYWHQIQGQLHLTDTQCCDLIVWTQKDMQIIRIVKDDSWAVNIPLMIDFYFKKFLPTLKQ